MCITREHRSAIAMIVAIGLIGGAAAIGQAAPVSIDDFDTPPHSVNDSSDDGSAVVDQAPNSGDLASPDPLGGYRDISVNLIEQTEGSDSSEVAVNPNGASSDLRVSNDEGARSYAGVQWDGDDGPGSEAIDMTGLGGLDLTGGGTNDRINVTVLANDAGAANLTFSAWNSDNGSGPFSLSMDIPMVDPDVASPETMSFLFSEFSGSPDFTNVGALEASFDGDNAIDGGPFDGETPLPSAADIQIGSVTATNAVPTPSALAGGLLLLSGLGLGRYRRRPGA